jgi:hypothetical protein
MLVAGDQRKKRSGGRYPLGIRRGPDGLWRAHIARPDKRIESPPFPARDSADAWLIGAQAILSLWP